MDSSDVPLPIGMGLLLLQFVRTLLIDIQKINDTGDSVKAGISRDLIFAVILLGLFVSGLPVAFSPRNGGTFRYVCFYGRRIFFGPDTDFGLQIFG